MAPKTLTACTVAALALCAGTLAYFVAAGPAKDKAKAFQPGKDGWLTLFDGSDLAKWERSKGSDWALKDGVLAGTKGEMTSYWHWTDFEAAAVVRGRGALRFRVSLAPMPDQEGYHLDLSDGTIRAAEGRAVAKGSGSASDGWREVRLTVSKGRFTVAFDGKKVAEGADNAYPAMGYLAFVPTRGRLEAKLLRVRPLNREKHVNVPSPNSACYVCHANFEGEPISKTHKDNDVACAACHGPSLAHRSDEDNVTTPDVMYARGEVEPACLKCHKRHKDEKKRKDGKGAPPKNAICTDCHGTHKGVN